MNQNTSGGREEDNVDWEGEIDDFSLSPCSSPVRCGTSLMTTSSVEAGPSGTKLFDHFVGMGFPEKLVHRVIQENGEENTDTLLETLLTYSALGESPEAETQAEVELEIQAQANRNPISDNLDSEDDISISGFSETEFLSDSEEITTAGSDEDERLTVLMGMGYSSNEALIALERCGPDTTVEEVTDFICAAQTAKEDDGLYPLEDPFEKPRRDCNNTKYKKRRMSNTTDWKKKKIENEGGDDLIRLPKPMKGFGIHTDPGAQYERRLPEAAHGPPYFYYENVALAPKGVWDTISRFLYDVEPEFVDSKYFCAAARKRGYIHNLPIVNRFPLFPLPPSTIHEALPMTRKWWPSWDTRTKLNCLQTSIASARLTDRIRKALEKSNGVGEPPLSVQRYVLEQCRKWNLVWVGKNKLAPLEPDEIEMLLGFPRNHTRGGGISRTDRYKSLGNSFQVDTVAFHLSVLKERFPNGVNLLSLFSGIGGAEVALHRLGIPLRTVVSVEISEVNRGIQRSWWEQTNQKGTLIDIADIQTVTADSIEQMINTYGGFDLVVGGSPCNNLAGSNRHTRDGLEGEHSSLFYDYFRILDCVKDIMVRYKNMV